MIRIALDAMGGDYAPEEMIKGALMANRELPVEVILVGKAEVLNETLKKLKLKLPFIPASETIAMDESPVQAVRQKKDSSINVAVSLVKEGKADAVVSAGNTGALMASAIFTLGIIKGVQRPAIATELPLPTGKVLLLDAGANVDCTSHFLMQFAEMGSLYAEHVFHIHHPRVGLLNIGEEKLKGNRLARESYPLLKQSPINFIGNVESKEILSGAADVVVCDGFIGNLILKFAESLGEAVFNLLKSEFERALTAKLGWFFLSSSFNKFKKTVTYDDYGAAPFLGIQGIVYKAHGRAHATAIKSAIRETAEAVKENLVGFISKMGENR